MASHPRLDLAAYVADITRAIPAAAGYDTPWALCANIAAILGAAMTGLGSDYEIRGDIARHRSATVEPGAVIKPPCLIGPDAFVAAHAYLRGGVFLAEAVSIGPSVEIKSSILLAGAKVAHLSFVGDSLIGAAVNIEAGAVIANHWNERDDKEISVLVGSAITRTGADKFGALVGDRSRIGANAVLSPGTILPPGSIVARLALVDQIAARDGG